MASKRAKAARFIRGNALGLVALFVALGGTSYAASQLPKNSVGNKQIKNGAVTSKKVKSNSISTSKIKNGSIDKADLKAGVIPTIPATATPTDGSVTASKLGKLPAVRLQPTNSYTQSVADIVSNEQTESTLLVFPGSALYNNDNLFTVDTFAGATALRIPVSGVYAVTAGLRWDFVAGGYRSLSIGTSTGGIPASSRVEAADEGPTRQSLSTSLYLTAGTQLYLFAGQNSGSAINVSQLQGTTHFSATLLTP